MDGREDRWSDIFGMSPDEMFRSFEEMFEDLFGHLEEGDEGGPAFFGFSMTQRPGEDPEVRSFGNVGEDTLYADGFVDTLVDVFDAGDEVHVVAEMPGITLEDVEIETSPRALRIRASGEWRSYDETVPLSVEVEPATVNPEYVNGVLKVVLGKA
ncbi:MAG: hypothetical protein MAG715_00321 [Methanonatronarchaeales archaeon]|nr:hypothetical protein [Methanonatronarchaeales archaeon]